VGYLPPVGRARCLRGLFANILIREEALGRGLLIVLEPPARWMGRRSPAPRLPPDQRAGGTFFSKYSQPAPLFRIFLNLFLKKLFRHGGLGMGAQSTSQAFIRSFLPKLFCWAFHVLHTALDKLIWASPS
jgi:hypothetical protein